MRHYFDLFVRELTADKKKTSFMLCALSLGLLLWGRLLLQGVPRTATAEDPIKTAKATDNTPGNSTDSTLGIAPDNTPENVEIRVIPVDLPAGSHRDLFGIDPSRYRRTNPRAYGGDRPKSASVTSDVDSRIAVVRDEAQDLKLEIVLIGTRPRAYINGRLLAPGNEYEGFTLIKVTDRHVILTKYGLLIRLKM